MTDAEKDAVWRLLPEDFKEDVRKDYADAKAAHELDPTNVRIDMHIIYLERYFGKHNLTATEDEPFKIGDIVKVSQDMKWGNGENDKNKEILLYAPSQITEIQGEHALIEGAGESVYGLIPLKHLIPYTQRQEPNSEPNHGEINLADKVINEDGEISVPVSIELDDSIWLTYRMELAKEVVKEVMTVKDISDYEQVAYRTMHIVDGIVERLKGGQK